MKADIREAREAALEESLAKLYKAYKNRLCDHIRRKFGGGPPDPEDVVQSAFLKYAVMPDRDLIDNPYAYIGQIASNLVLDDRRKAQRHADSLREIVEVQGGEQRCDPSGERIVLGREELSIITSAIQAMPRTRRRILILNRVHGLSLAEIGRRMGMSAPGVRKHLMRGLEELQAAMAGAE